MRPVVALSTAVFTLIATGIAAVLATAASPGAVWRVHERLDLGWWLTAYAVLLAAPLLLAATGYLTLARGRWSWLLVAVISMELATLVALATRLRHWMPIGAWPALAGVIVLGLAVVVMALSGPRPSRTGESAGESVGESVRDPSSR